MAITAYTGPPGAGKSYAMVQQVILPALRTGRRVLTNIDGCDPAKFTEFLLAEGVGAPGELVIFEGQQALLPSFFPTQDRPTGTFVLGGDLLVFDEWRLTFSNRGQVGNPSLEPFLRWHRHLTDENGLACDVVIGSQLVTDIHSGFRGLVERSYKFRKLSAVGAPKFYSFDIYEGHEQRKGTAFRKGSGQFHKRIFALYKSFDTEKDGTEAKTDNRSTLFSRLFVVLGVVAAVLIGGGSYFAYHAFGPSQPDLSVPSSVPSPSGGTPAGGYLPSLPGGSSSSYSSSLRIVGVVSGASGDMVIVSDKGGAMRPYPAREFVFENGRPVSGLVDGVRVYAQDIIVSASPSSVQLPGL